MKLKLQCVSAFLILLFGMSQTFADSFYGYDCCRGNIDCCGQGFEFGLWFDPMAVKPCQMPLEFAEAQRAEAANLAKNEDFFLDPGFEFGFRVGMGFKPRCGNWSFRADYTHWCNETKDSASLTGTGVTGPGGLVTNLEPKIADTFGLTNTLANAGEVGRTSTKLEYTYNLLDVTAGWSCCLCNGLLLTPFGGFRGFWYSTDVKETTSNSAGTTFSTSGDTSTAKNDFSAYGIVGGLRFNYNLYSCFNFYGWFGGSIVAGENDNKIEFVSTGTGGFIETEKETICLFIHSLEGAFGITYDTCFCGYYGHIGLGYEVTQWNEVLPHPFRQNSTSPGNATKTSNGLFVQAITVRLGMAF